jgi:WD40 repeat protein
MRWWFVATMGLAASNCSPAAPTTRAAPVAASAPAPASEPLRCATVSCWQARAGHTLEAGIADVGAAELGRAFELSADPAILEQWVRALHASGQLREARRVLGRATEDPALHQAAEQLLTSLPNAPAPAPSGAIDPHFESALVALDAGQLDEALRQLQAIERPTPVTLAELGDLLDRRGDRAAARAAYARARIAIDQRGASLQLLATDRWRLDGVMWQNGKLVVSRSLEPAGHHDLRFRQIETWSPNSPRAPRRITRLPQRRGLRPSSDPTRVIAFDGDRIELRDATTFAVLESFLVAGKRVGPIASIGTGDDLELAVAVGSEVLLLDPHGKQRARFGIEGRTPTVTRVYSGHSTHHDNILGETASYVVTLALSPDGRYLAAGGSDAKVTLFDRRGGKRVLTGDWPFDDHRMMGGNPNLNVPIAMRFDGDALVVVHRWGDVIRWRAANGGKIHHHDGRCNDGQAQRVANRFTAPGAANAPITDDHRGHCSGSPAVLSADARQLATVSFGDLHVRRLPDGAPLALELGQDMLGNHLAFSPGGRLAVASYEGRVAIWTASAGLKTMLAKRSSGPLSPHLTSDGRYLTVEAAGNNATLWDLREGVRMRPSLYGAAEGASMLAVHPRWGVVTQGPQGVELHRGRARQRLAKRARAARFFGDRLVLDQGGCAVEVFRVDGDGAESTGEFECRGGVALKTGMHNRLLSVDGTALQVWDLDKAALVRTITASQRVHSAALAPYGRYVVWLEQGKKPNVSLHLRALHGATSDSTSDKRRELAGWASGVAVAPNGKRVVVLLQHGIAFYEPERDALDERRVSWAIPANRLHFSDDGRLLIVENYDAIDLRLATGVMSRVATLHTTTPDEWLVQSASGAVEGSPGAANEVLGHAVGPPDSKERHLISGRAVWDRFFVAGTYRAALAGESLAPNAPGHVLPDPSPVDEETLVVRR